MDTGAELPQMSPGPSPYAGVPFRGPPMNVREDDPPHMQPKWNYTPHVRIFDLSDEGDTQAYLEVLHKVTLGECIIGLEDVRFVQKTNSWKTLLRWYDQFLTAPTTEVESNGKPVWPGTGQNGTAGK